ncbi:MAG: alpha/beta hydrolase [Chloroflexota bacterium]|nr:alpha/beta hydrolase [Chloroflexota bacterium]
MLNEQPFNTGTVTLNIAEGSAIGPPLVLLHGGSARWQGWDPIIPELVASWQLFALDLRGHGKSGRVPWGYRLQDYADDVAALLRERIREPAVLFGHSLGGIIALLVAAQQPAYVRGVVVGDSPLTSATWQTLLLHDRIGLATWRDLSGGQRSLDQIVATLKDTPVLSAPDKPATVRMRDVWGEDSPAFTWIAENVRQQDPDVLGILLDDFAHAAAGYEMERLFPATGCPVLLLQADPAAGGVMTDAEVAQALPLLRQPAHVRLAGLSHILHSERKEPVLEAVLPFLTSL